MEVNISAHIIHARLQVLVLHEVDGELIHGDRYILAVVSGSAAVAATIYIKSPATITTEAVVVIIFTKQNEYTVNPVPRHSVLENLGNGNIACELGIRDVSAIQTFVRARFVNLLEFEVHRKVQVEGLRIGACGNLMIRNTRVVLDLLVYTKGVAHVGDVPLQVHVVIDTRDAERVLEVE